MNISVTIQQASEGEDVPEPPSIQKWINAALHDYGRDAELTVRIVNPDEMCELNHRYRNRDQATNVLSFPADIPEHIDLPLLGDLVICAAVVNSEASEQNKSQDAHWAHMLIHGTLHLLGYDHINEDDATIMENLEISLLQKLDFPNPYIHIE